MDDHIVGVYGSTHASAYFHVMDCNVSETTVESDVDVGILYVTGADLDLMFQVWV